MFIKSITAFNVYFKFNTLRKQPSIASLFPSSIHSYYDQTELKMSCFGRLVSPRAIVKKVAEKNIKYNKTFKNPWNATWIPCLLEFSDWLLNGDLHHIVFRKLAFHRIVQACLMSSNSTIKQLVILGSGIDHIGWLFSEKCTCFELDIEPMIRFKKKIIPPVNQNIHYSNFNSINNSLSRCLNKQSAFNPNKPCLFITEGFIDYIPKENLQSLLSQIKHLHPKNEWISTHFDRSLLSSKQRFFFELGVQITGEQLQASLTKEHIISIGSNYGFVLVNEWAGIPELLDEQTTPINSKLNTIEKRVLNRENMNGCTIMYFK